MGMKDIQGYEGLYAVTREGQIWSYKRCKFLKPRLKNSGYYYVVLNKQGVSKECLIHRLVLKTFKPIKNMDNMTVNHKDENKLNNNLSNLEWMTQQDNNNYGNRNITVSKKMSKTVQCIETGQIFNSLKDVEQCLHLKKMAVSVAARNPNRTSGGLHWKYID